MKFTSTSERELSNSSAGGGNSRLVRGFTKKDLLFSIATGLITGIIAWQIFVFLGVFEKLGFEIRPAVMILVVPILWILGVNLGYFLGRWMPFFNQFGKYAAIGFTNAAVYFGILNLLIATSDITRGIWYSIFVTMAFIVGTVHSYIWNKFWAFQAAQSQGGSAEFAKFAVVSIIAGLINVSIASLVVNFLDPMFGVSRESWANLGGIAGSAVALVFSFVGFRLLVFKASKLVSQ